VSRPVKRPAQPYCLFNPCSSTAGSKWSFLTWRRNLAKIRHQCGYEAFRLLRDNHGVLLQPKKLKPGRKALNDVLAHVVKALEAPNRRDSLKFGIFIVRTSTYCDWPPSPLLMCSVCGPAAVWQSQSRCTCCARGGPSHA